MTRITFPAETPAARIEEPGLVEVDGIEYVAHHSHKTSWMLQTIGKRGKPVNQYRLATVVGGVVVHLRGATRI